MVKYTVTVTTGDKVWHGTFDHIFITLYGTEGKSERKKLNEAPEMSNGVEKEYTVECPAKLGKVILISLDKEQYLFLPDQDWYCLTVKVHTPENETLHFPCYSWVKERQILHVREGKALTLKNEIPALMGHRLEELELRKQQFEWKELMEGLPHCLALEDPKALPAEFRYSLDKRLDLEFTTRITMAELKMKFLATSKKPWGKLDDIKQVFWFYKTQLFDYVTQHWKDDEFFGFQLLNGANPMMIQCCKVLPKKFAVTEEMVTPFLEDKLPVEIQSGNIFLCDYSRLAEVPPNVINMRLQYVPAPFCLLFKNKLNRLLPIAIQLQQEPGEKNPVFLPNDEEAWLLAKTHVRAADFIEHQFNFHLLRTHLLAEAYILATLRNLPSAHPIYKLLIPHMRFTLYANTLGREKLISEKGAISMYTSTGSTGMVEVMRRAMHALKYSSLCLPDDIIERGLDKVPKYYYRDDGLLVWGALSKYVEAVIAVFYPSDMDVLVDEELQHWISDIYKHGFLEKASTGIPNSFKSTKEVTKFITMVIFTMTAQHSALNNGNFDFGGWLPNSPNSLQSGAPQSKDDITEADLLNTLPDINTSVWGMAGAWITSKKGADFVSLGQHSEKYFSEPEVLSLTDKLKEELKEISEKIKERNKEKKRPYTYLDPEKIENSITI
ncbi:hydroperoxide isomerase ALOXE3-like isoform X1 [Alosa sapidissima]|uniref:hydroperoxide isomerase ALOXE3-like isoform X1 n=1 Tax=Alosa sapidissima TaxID=34773 RepID=UPI001C084786|nr:hydroperoxide isomerase ALOXE3-like isoform X1 [Alosa sapidissima]